MERTLRVDVSFDRSIISTAVLTHITVDYNSWIESDKALRLAKSLPKDTVIVEGQDISPLRVIITNLKIGYKQFDTGRTYMAKMGDWRHNKDEEIELDGIGGVNIIVKADVHRSGMHQSLNYVE